MIRSRSLAAVLTLVASIALTTAPASSQSTVDNPTVSWSAKKHQASHHRRHHVRHYRHTTRHASGGDVVGGRPSGCPHRFCGCEASIYLFGRIIPELNLAWNWPRKFRRASPAPRMAAARPGHVMVLIHHVSGDDWFVHDGNSGGGKTREHVRSIRGYTIVNPGTAYAGLRP